MDGRTWTCKDILDWTTSYLERKGDEHPRISAQWLLCAVTGLSRVELYTHFDQPLSPEELAAMHKAIERRVAGEPLQYVTGDTAFRHIIVRCEPEVLIPRPETELLVDFVLDGLPRAADGTPMPALVLEVGTGTGCIACSLARERAKTHVVATDVSPAAIALATRNRDALHLAPYVDIVPSDLAAGIDPALMGHFEALVSNPPYIPSAVIPTLPHEVEGFEPHLALTASTSTAGCSTSRLAPCTPAASLRSSSSRRRSTRRPASHVSRADGPRSRSARTTRTVRVSWSPAADRHSVGSIAPKRGSLRGAQPA